MPCRPPLLTFIAGHGQSDPPSNWPIFCSPIFTPPFIPIFCQFVVYSFGLSRVKCNTFAAVTQFVATSSCICIAVCKQFFNANLSCGFVAPLHIDVCVYVGGVANVFVIAIWCMTHGICVIPLNIMQNVQDFSESDNVYDIE